MKQEIPQIGTKEFNDLASAYFGGKPKQETLEEVADYELALQIRKKYNECRNNYCNRLSSIENAINDTFPNNHIYIHKDIYEDFSHIFINNYVFFEDGSIYSKIIVDK